MNIPSTLATLDPANASDQASTWMCAQLYNGLVEFDADLQVQPSLARRWEVTDSGATYTFFLRNDVYFHKDPLFGPDSTRRLTAADVEYSFRRICDPQVAAKGFWIFNGKIRGLTEYRAGAKPRISGFRALDDTTFQVQLLRPFPPFLGTLAMAYGSIVPQEVAEHYGKDFRSHPVGTGPFRLKTWDEGASLILLKNQAYFERDAAGEALPYLDAVQVRFIRDKLSEFAELMQGRLDFVNGLDKSTKDEIFLPDGTVKPEYEEQFNFFTAPQLNTEFIGILVDSAAPALRGHPLASPLVRLALNFAIDREKLVDYLLNGNGYPANSGIVPQGMPGFNKDSVDGFWYDPDLAAQLLEAAGYPGGRGIPVLSLKSNPSYQAVMEYVQKSFERIGITMTIDNMDGATLREMAANGEINLWRASWIADYPDPENYLGLFYSGNIPPNGANRFRYENPRYDSLFEAASAVTDDSLRQAMYWDMENTMMGQAPIIPLYYDKILRIVSKDISGLETNGMNMLYLKRVRKGA